MSKNINRVIDALHGAIAKYDQEKDQFLFQYCSRDAANLFGVKIERLHQELDGNAMKLVCECEREQVEKTLRTAMEQGKGVNVYFRLRNKSNQLRWCQLDSWSDDGDYYVLLSGMSPEIQLFQSIAGETADDIYVIDRKNYNLLYANELGKRLCRDDNWMGHKCYQILHGRTEPCEFCIQQHEEQEHGKKEQIFEENGRFFLARFRETDWNGIPAYVKYVRDITEEVKSRKEKERLEQYFQTVVKYLPGGMAVIHHEVGGGVKPEYLSDGFAEMLHMSIEDAWDIYEKDALSGVHPDDKAVVRQSLETCISEKRERYELQYRLKRAGDEYIWVNAKFSVIPCDGGDVRVYADYHDITAERKMQEQLRQQYREQINQHYMLAGPDALLLGHCNITRDKIYEIVDYTDSDLLDTFGDVREDFFIGLGTLIVDEKEREEFYSKYLNEPAMQAFQDGIKEVIMPCFIMLPKQKVGRYIQFKMLLVATPDTEDVTGILTVTDITEKTIREKIFMQLSSINYDLVANINLFADSYEIVSGGDDNISEVKGSFAERTNRIIAETVVQNEFEKEHVKEMLSPSVIMERLKDQDNYSFTYSIYDANGEVRTKNMTVSAVDMSLGRVCLIRADVTDVLAAERRAKEELEMALEEAKKANRVKSDFFSSMSHDIRTPMNAIVGMTTLALANINNTHKMEEYLRKISISSQHLLSLINDILDMSQIEQSKIHLNQQAIRMEELVDHISSIMMSSAENAGLRFDIKVGNFEHGSFIGDALRIKQIIINLLSNAFKFTMEGGVVLFQTEELAARQDNHVRYCFTIQDSGIGMSEEFLSHIFEPFIRSDKVSKVEGSGLGLSITKGLVELMGGEIRVTSKLQEGTTFEIELEFELAEEEKKENDSGGNSEQMEEDLSGCHFLLVEDNEINSEILGELLQMRGATFTVKTNGMEAVNEMKRVAPGTYDAIFMDIQMPVMNGYDATREIRKLDHPDVKSIIILAMTANAFAEDVQAAMDAGMNGHIAKPVDMKLLYNTISAMLKKKKDSQN